MLKFTELETLKSEERNAAIQEALNKVEALIQQGADARERGEMRTADMYLSSAFAIALDYGWPEKAVNAAAHQAIIFKIRYSVEGKNPRMLTGMYAQLQKALAVIDELHVQGQPTAVVDLRFGDYYMLKGDYETADEHYAKAVATIGEGKTEYAEYLSHYGLFQVVSGKPAEGISKLEDAEMLIEQETRFEPSHRLTVVCGIQLRLVEGYRQIGDLASAESKLTQARLVAEDLATNHHSPHRLMQVEALQAQLSQSLMSLNH